ncbi:MAG: Hsp33 family molecular chaperone HslO, partial [Paracoccaceae bacterium]
YPVPVEAIVAEAAVLTALIGQTIDLRWKLSLQIRGNGPLRIIATDYYGPRDSGTPARMRAYASFDRDELTAAKGSPFEMIGAGMFAVLIDQGKGSEPYHGITPLAGGSLAACAETYFSKSEQLPTRFRIALGQSREPGSRMHWRVGGVMIQHLPKASPHAKGAQKNSQQESDAGSGSGENWERIARKLQSIEELELVGPNTPATDLLSRRFHDERPRVFDAQAVRFGCTCGPESVVQTMSIYSAKDIKKMTNAEGKVTADCQFCGAHYALDPETLGFQANRKPD